LGHRPHPVHAGAPVALSRSREVAMALAAASARSNTAAAYDRPRSKAGVAVSPTPKCRLPASRIGGRTAPAPALTERWPVKQGEACGAPLIQARAPKSERTPVSSFRAPATGRGPLSEVHQSPCRQSRTTFGTPAFDVVDGARSRHRSAIGWSS
jgi:hypothetical protein